MESLAIYDQPHAEWLGEVYVAITPENMKEMVMRINDHPDNPEHELSDWDAQRLCDQPCLLFQWLDEGLAAFKPFEKCTVYIGPLFSSNGQTTVSLNTDWEEPHTDTW